MDSNTMIKILPWAAAALAGVAMLVAAMYAIIHLQQAALARQARTAIARAGGGEVVAHLDAADRQRKASRDSLFSLVRIGHIMEHIPGLAALTDSLTEMGTGDPRSRLSQILGIANLPHQLDSAGYSSKGLTPRDIVSAKYGGMLLTLLIAIVLGILPTSLSSAILFLFLMYMGFYLPTYLVREAITKRAAAIRGALARAADVIAMSVSAGIPIERAVDEYCKLFENPLSDEFTRTLDEINVGRSSRDAWIATAERNVGTVDELSRFASSIAQALTMGTPLETTLRSQARELRTRRRQLFQAAAARAPIKMIIPLVFLLLPALLVVLMGPIAVKMIGGGG
jgi:tight adherence protein C